MEETSGDVPAADKTDHEPRGERVAVVSCGYEPTQRNATPAEYDFDRRAVDLAVLAAQEGHEIAWWPMWRDAQVGDLMLFRLAEHERVALTDDLRALARKYARADGIPEPDHPQLTPDRAKAFFEKGYNGLAVVTAPPREWSHDDGRRTVSVSVSGCLLFSSALPERWLRSLLPHEEALKVAADLPCASRSGEQEWIDRPASTKLLDCLEQAGVFPQDDGRTAPAVRQLRVFARALRRGVPLDEASSLAPPRMWVHDAPEPLRAPPEHPFLAARIDVGRHQVEPFVPKLEPWNTGWHYADLFASRLAAAAGKHHGAAALLVAVNGWSSREMRDVVRREYSSHAIDDARMMVDPSADLYAPALIASPRLDESAPVLLIVEAPAAPYHGSSWQLDPAALEWLWRQGHRWWKNIAEIKSQLSEAVDGDLSNALAHARTARTALAEWMRNESAAVDGALGQRFARTLFDADTKLAGLPSSLSEAEMLDGFQALSARPLREIGAPLAQAPGLDAATGPAHRWVREVIRERQQTRESADSAARLFAAISATETQRLLSRTDDARRGVITAGVVTLLLAAVALLVATAAVPVTDAARYGDLDYVGAVIVAVVLSTVLIGVGFAHLADCPPWGKGLRHVHFVFAIVALLLAGMRWTVSTWSGWLWLSLGAVVIAIATGAKNSSLNDEAEKPDATAAGDGRPPAEATLSAD